MASHLPVPFSPPGAPQPSPHRTAVNPRRGGRSVSPPALVAHGCTGVVTCGLPGPLGGFLVGSVHVSPLSLPPWPGDMIVFPPLSVMEAAGNTAPPSSSGSSTSGSISIADSRVVVGVPDPEVVEEFFGQLWIISDSPSPPPSSTVNRCLVWICKDLLATNSFSLSDCFPAAVADRFHLAHQIEISNHGGWESFAGILGRPQMVGGNLGRGRGRPPWASMAPPPSSGAALGA
jgi:hypothetical protein